MKDRIRAIMEMYDMTQQNFAQKLGLSPAAISSIFTGRTNPTNNHIQAIHKAFPEVSTNWVLFGEGEMLTGSHPSASVGASGDSGQNFGFSKGDVMDIGASLFENEIGTTLFSEVPAMPAKTSSATVNPSPASATMNFSTPASVSKRSMQDPNELAKNIDRPQRKIKEIRVFFDDGTFEAFSPSSK